MHSIASSKAEKAGPVSFYRPKQPRMLEVLRGIVAAGLKIKMADLSM